MLYWKACSSLSSYVFHEFPIYASGEVADIGVSAWFPVSKWETWMELLIPSSPVLTIMANRGVNQEMEKLFVFLSLSLLDR